MVDERNRLIGENLRKYRLLKGLTQDELAEGLCSVSQLSKVENGKTYLKRSLLKQMSNRLGVTIERIETADALREELSEKLQLAKDASHLGNKTLALSLASEVSDQAHDVEYLKLRVDAVLLKSRLFNETHQFREAVLLIESLLADNLPLNPIQRTLLFMTLGRSYEESGNTLLAHEYYFKADDEFANTDAEKEVELRVCFELARCHFSMNNNRTAYRYCEKAEQIAAELSLHLMRIRSTYTKATMLKRMGDWEQAEQIFLAALKEAEDNAMLLDVAIIHNNMGQLFQERGEYGQAMNHYHRSLQVFDLLNEHRYATNPLLHIAELAVIEGNLTLAVRHIERVFTITSQQENILKGTEAQASRILAWVKNKQGKFGERVAHLEQALRLFDECEQIRDAYETAKELAEAYFEKDDAKSLAFYRQAIAYNEKNLHAGRWK